MRKAKQGPRSPSRVDVAVALNVRLWRLWRGLSQAQLAARLGLTFQQVQKYETGGNRIPTGRLVKLAAILNVPVSALFHGADGDEPLVVAELISDSRSFRLAHAFATIKNNKARVSLVNLVEKIAASVPQKPEKRRRR
jgi:transcriptional regulator with XRE-family HTH domain